MTIELSECFFSETVMLEESTAHLIESLLMADHDWRLGSRALLHSELEELFASVAFSVAENDINSICYSQLKTMLVRLLCETMSGISVKCLTTVLRQLVVRLSTAIFHWMSSGHANDLQVCLSFCQLYFLTSTDAVYTFWYQIIEISFVYFLVQELIFYYYYIRFVFNVCFLQ